MAVGLTERLRRSYKPKRITLLFVGESAPAGGTFFYDRNSTLYFEMRAAFINTMPRAFKGIDFLEGFRGLGCYLDDLCLEPVNDLPDDERKQKRVEAEAGFARRLRRYDPEMVVAIGKTTTARHARAAVGRADLSDLAVAVVSFPGRPAHKVDFHRDMGSILCSALKTGVLRPYKFE